MAPVPTVKMRIIRGVYIDKVPQAPGAIVDVPVLISRQLVSDHKAVFIKDEPKAVEEPAPVQEKKEPRRTASRE